MNKLDDIDAFKAKVRRFMASLNKPYVKPPPANLVGKGIADKLIGGKRKKEKEV